MNKLGEESLYIENRESLLFRLASLIIINNFKQGQMVFQELSSDAGQRRDV